MIVLVINAGSSSIKYQLLDVHTAQVLAKGGAERIGLDGIEEAFHKMHAGEVLRSVVVL